MLDLSDIGKAGLIIQYEDIIGMIGYNVAKYFKGKGVSKKLDSTSIQDVLLSYINRKDMDYSIWLIDEYGITVNPNALLTSLLTMQPNLMYSYKVFSKAHEENINSLYIYSNMYSPIIEEATKSYGFDGIQYIHCDIIGFLKTHPNYTYLTSDVNNIKKCVDLDSPVCLVVCDDYMYTSDIFVQKIDKSLSDKPNIILRFTGVKSAGII
jgi:hypothetical protein